MNPKPVVIVLAAGRSSRFAGAQHKLVQPLDARTVLGRTIAHAQASGLPLVVVTTAPLAAEAQRWVDKPDIVLVPEATGARGARSGMGYSIACGVMARPDAAGWVVLPGDMPLVQPATLQAVAAGLDHYAVVFAQHKGRRGHPVAFAAELFADLSQLSGDQGARRVIARYPSMGVEANDPGVLIDVDTSADLEAIRSSDGANGVSDATAV